MSGVAAARFCRLARLAKRFHDRVILPLNAANRAFYRFHVHFISPLQADGSVQRAPHHHAYVQPHQASEREGLFATFAARSWAGLPHAPHLQLPPAHCCYSCDSCYPSCRCLQWLTL